MSNRWNRWAVALFIGIAASFLFRDLSPIVSLLGFAAVMVGAYAALTAYARRSSGD